MNGNPTDSFSKKPYNVPSFTPEGAENFITKALSRKNSQSSSRKQSEDQSEQTGDMEKFLLKSEEFTFDKNKLLSKNIELTAESIEFTPGSFVNKSMSTDNNSYGHKTN